MEVNINLISFFGVLDFRAEWKLWRILCNSKVIDNEREKEYLIVPVKKA